MVAAQSMVSVEEQSFIDRHITVTDDERARTERVSRTEGMLCMTKESGTRSATDSQN